MQDYVMLVDDERPVLNYLKAILGSYHYNCLAFDNARAALQHLEQERLPALILLDLKMPGLNGWEFGELVARDPRLQGIPVALMSGDVRGRQTFHQAAHLQKPFDLGQLLAVVTEYCPPSDDVSP